MNVSVGLTGNIASGKSMIASVLLEHGAAVLDADLVGKRVLAEDIDGALQRVRSAFGDSVFDGNELNRRRLGNMVFGDRVLLAKLNSITIPVMTRLINSEMRLLRRGHRVIVLDAAILIEAGWQKMVDEIWVVRASKEDQLQRLMTRDRLSFGEATNRIEAQMSLEEKLRYADVVIDNTLDMEQTRAQVEQLWRQRLQNR